MSRSMIVGRARSHIVGAARDPYAGLLEFSGYGQPTVVGHDQYGRPMIVGADAPAAAVAPAISPAQPVAYVRSGEGPQVIEEHPKHPREFPIGFQQVAPPIPGNTTQGIEQKPQVLFRGERLAVPNTIVINFDVNDIKVGKDSQLASPGNMPSECFSNLSVGVRMQLDTAEPGITITLSMFNTDVNPHFFKSVLYGTVIE